MSNISWSLSLTLPYLFNWSGISLNVFFFMSVFEFLMTSFQNSLGVTKLKTKLKNGMKTPETPPMSENSEYSVYTWRSIILYVLLISKVKNAEKNLSGAAVIFNEVLSV
jgi:hypothetical protein